MRLPPRLLLWAAPIPLLATVLVRGGDSPGLMAGDYAHYLLHARAIVEGHAYTDVGFLYSEYNPFIGPKAQPPGLPLALAGAFVLFGENEMIATLLVFATGIGFLLLVGHYFFRREEPWLGIGVALMSGLSLRFVHHSSQVLSDVPFAMLIWSVIIVADRPEQWTWRRTAAIAGLGVAAILVRLAGVPLVLAMVIFAALHFRQHGLRPLVPAAVWIAAFLIISRAIPVSAAVASEVSFGPMEMLRMTLTNIRNYSLTVPESHLYPFPWDRVNDIYHVIAFAIMLVGLIAWMRTSYRSLVVAFAVSYLAMLAILPGADSRYLWPLFPIFVFGLLNGANVIVARLAGARNLGWRGPAIAGAALAIAAGSAIRGVSAPPRESLVERSDVQELFGRLEAIATVQDTRALFFKPRVLTWETRIPATGMFRAAPTEFAAELRRLGITHVVVGDLDLYPELAASVREAVVAAPSLFVPVWRNQSFTLYAVANMPPPLPAAPPRALLEPRVGPGRIPGTAPARVSVATHVFDARAADL